MQNPAIFPPLGGASSTLKQNGIYIALTSFVREITTDPQVASGTTREEPYFYCHLSYTKSFFFQHRVPWTWFPQKARSEGDASTQMIASLHCINTRIPRRDKINSHISSIIAEKENQQNTVTKLYKLKQKIRDYKEQTKRSLNQMQDQYTSIREERK